MRHLVVGSGPAGIFAAEGIRRRDALAPLTLVSEEGPIAYSPVMVTYWIGENVPREGLFFRDPSWAEKKMIDLKIGRRALSLRASSRHLILESGEEIPYDRILIATGSLPLFLPIPGADLRGVCAVRRPCDGEAILEKIPSLRRVVIIGGGFIGLKLACHLKERGVEAVILEKERKLAPRVFDERASRFLIRHLRRQGIRVETGEEVEEILGLGGKVWGARMKGGGELSVQLIVQAVGVRPNVEFLADSGIALDHGIPVNARMETALPGVYAAGDVTLAVDSIAGQRANNATWPAACRQGIVAGTNMAGGNLEYLYNFPLNSIRLLGLPVLSAGYPAEETGEVVADEGKEFLHRMVFKDGRLIGFILIGEISQAGFLLSVMKRKETLSRPEEILERDFSCRRRLPRGYGYRHGILFGTGRR